MTRYVDLFDTLAGANARAAIDDVVPRHYSPLGNRLVAERLWQYLEAQRLTERRASGWPAHGR